MKNQSKKINTLATVIGCLGLFHCQTVCAQTSSDIKRTEIKLESDEVLMGKSYLMLSGGKGSSNSTLSPSSYSFSTINLKIGTKMVAGNVDENGSIGFAVAPDLYMAMRLDPNGKKMRLEVNGKLISLFDYHQIFNDHKMTLESRENKLNTIKAQKKTIAGHKQAIEKESKYIEALKNLKNFDVTDEQLLNGQFPNIEEISAYELERLVNLYEYKSKSESCKKNVENQKECLKALRQWVKSEKFHDRLQFSSYITGAEQSINGHKADIEILEKGIIRDYEDLKEDEKKLAHATLDVSIGNLGIEHRDIADMLYKYTGFKGSLVSLSFDVSGKNKLLKVGLCGSFEPLTLEAGKYSGKLGETGPNSSFYKASLGSSGSVCARIGVGPVVISNTLSAKTNNFYLENNFHGAIDNTARIGVQTKVIPGAHTDFGAFHTYGYEVIGGNKVGTHIIGGGVTVLAK